jgi:ribokinase
MSARRVVVLGSANLDEIALVADIPAPGETVLSGGRQDRAGGKGLNQAVAAVRAGVPTTLLAAVGVDAAGDLLLAEARAAGIDASLVRRVDTATGTAWIMVRSDGENAIVVDAGANRQLRELTDAERAAIGGAAVLVVQLEIPLPTVAEAVSVAHAQGVQVVLNPAPSQTLPADLLAAVDVLVVNEHEARQLAAAAEATSAEAATALLTSVAAVVVTLGADGALVAVAGSQHHVSGIPAEVVDTTGAGDTFTGVLAAALADGEQLIDAVRRAVVAGALAVESAGAVPSIPDSDQVARRLRILDGRTQEPRQ